MQRLSDATVEGGSDDEGSGRERSSTGSSHSPRYASRLMRARAAKAKAKGGAVTNTAPLLSADMLNAMPDLAPLDLNAIRPGPVGDTGTAAVAANSVGLGRAASSESNYDAPMMTARGALPPLQALQALQALPAASKGRTTAQPIVSAYSPSPSTGTEPASSAAPAFAVGSGAYVMRSNGAQSLAVVESYDAERDYYTVLIDEASGLRKRASAAMLRALDPAPAGVDALRWATCIEYAKCKGSTPHDALAAADARSISTSELRGHVSQKLEQREKLLAMLSAYGLEPGMHEQVHGWSNGAIKDFLHNATNAL